MSVKSEDFWDGFYDAVDIIKRSLCDNNNIKYGTQFREIIDNIDKSIQLYEKENNYNEVA